MTDGQKNRGPDLSTLQDRVIKDQVRIVTMAVGTDSDQALEDFARWSNGQTYFIHDGKYLVEGFRKEVLYRQFR